MNHWINGWKVDECMNEWLNEWPNVCMHAWVNNQVNCLQISISHPTTTKLRKIVCVPSQCEIEGHVTFSNLRCQRTCTQSMSLERWPCHYHELRNPSVRFCSSGLSPGRFEGRSFCHLEFSLALHRLDPILSEPAYTYIENTQTQTDEWMDEQGEKNRWRNGWMGGHTNK